MTVQSPPVIARFNASNRRKVDQFKKFPSHVVVEQAVATVARVALTSNLLAVVL